MRKIPAVPLALVVGVGIGFFITKAANPANADRGGKSSSAEGGAASNLRTRPAARISAAGNASTVTFASSAHSARSLAALCELIDDHGGAQVSIAFLEAIERLGAEEIAALMSDLGKLKPSDARRYQLCNALINRWATIDPDGAWDAAMQFDDKDLKRQMIGLVIGQISQSDIGKARHLLAEIKDPQTKQAALYAFLNQAASEDPEEVFRVLASESGNSQNYGNYQTLFQKWAMDDPDAAIAKLNQIKGTSDRQQALHGIVTALVSSDPKRAQDMLDEMPPGENRAAMLSSLASTWMSKDSDAAIAWINGLPAADKSKALENCYYHLIQEDPAKAAVLLASLPANNMISHYFSNLASQWAQQDLEAARQWVESLPVGQTREQAMNGIISNLSQTDPAKAAAILGDAVVTNRNSSEVGTIVAAWIKTDQTAALAWLDSLDLKGDAQRNVHSQFIQNWVNEDAPAASRYALGIQDEKVRQQTISSLVGAWGRQDPRAAREWIMSTLEGDSKNSSLNSLIQTLSYQDPSTAQQYYMKATANLAPETVEKTFGSTASQIAGNLIQHDPKAAGKWVMSLPEGESRSNSIRTMVDNLGDYDIKGAANFVGTLAAGKDRDQAVGSLVSDLNNQGDSQSAFDWAASISDASKREGMIRSAANHWKEYDPAAARTAVGRADISDEAKNRILKSFQN